MLVEHERADGIDARSDGHELGDHILTGALILEHLADAANLTLDSSQSGVDLLAGRLIAHRSPLHPRERGRSAPLARVHHPLPGMG